MEWKKGLPAQTVLPDKVLEYINLILFPHFYKMFEDEKDKEVIEKTLECIRDLCDELGPASIVDQVDKFVIIINMLLEKKSYCQTKSKNFKGEVEGEDD